MSFKLSIVIACHNDPDIRNTVDSVYATSGGRECEIIVVDDCSSRPVESLLPKEQYPEVRIIRNALRCGCGPSRHIGVLESCGDWILFIDPHMRFVQGWYEEAKSEIQDFASHVTFCGQCIAIDERNMDPLKSRSSYQGAHLVLDGPDRHDPKKLAVMEVQWNPATPELENMEAIGALMGACYFVNKQSYLETSPLQFLRVWGSDELLLSLHAWMFGHGVCYLKNVRIGHRFRLKNEKMPFVAPVGYPTWNKMFAIATLLPSSMLMPLMTRLKESVPPQEWQAAWEMYKRDYHLIWAERCRLRNLCDLTEAWNAYATRFDLPIA